MQAPSRGSTLVLPSLVFEAVRDRVQKAEFLEHLDILRVEAFERLEATYGDAYYAKLVTLKLLNFLLSRYHQGCGHVRLASGPWTLMIDPSNGCSLRCPGCLHSANRRFVKNIDWPAGTLRLSTLERVLRIFGPTVLGTTFYNYGEPLLNKRLPEFIELARQYASATNLSSSMSVRFDVEAFVRAMPDFVILSIDGIHRESYGRFRRRGNLELVFENVREIVRLKQRLGLERPILCWRFLTSEHNVHEVDDALELGRKLGADRMIIGTPFDVSVDDPSVRVATSPRKGEYNFADPHVFRWTREHVRSGLRDRPEVHKAFSRGWTRVVDPRFICETVRDPDSTCEWLYGNLTLDATDRLLPCCIAPGAAKNLVFGNAANPDTWQSGDGFRRARLSLASRARFQAETAAPEGDPHCAKCPRRPPFSFPAAAAVNTIRELDPQNAVIDSTDEEWTRLARGIR